MKDINNLKNWTEIAKGLYWFPIMKDIWYEIHIKKLPNEGNLLDAAADVYEVGDWTELATGKQFFERSKLNEEQDCDLEQCLDFAACDYEISKKVGV